MDRDLADLKRFGIFRIFRESFKIIFSFKKIFSHITLALIFPLTFVSLAQFLLSNLFGKNYYSEGTIYSFDNEENSDTPMKNRLTSGWVYFYLFTAAYLIFVVIFSLLSTSAVVYAVACIYTGKPMTFKKVMGVVPKVWKRLLVTFFWNFVILVAYHVAMVIVFAIWAVSIANASVAGSVILIVLLIIYFVGLVYINVIWQLASLVSVLEEVYGLKAWKKSRILIKGKLFAASFIYVVMDILFVAIEGVFEVLVVHGNSIKMVYRVLLGILCFLVVLKLLLLSFVLQTVIYFVCKSYHYEIIDKSSLSEHLESYQGDYVRLRGSREVQLEQHSNV